MRKKRRGTEGEDAVGGPGGPPKRGGCLILPPVAAQVYTVIKMYKIIHLFCTLYFILF